MGKIYAIQHKTSKKIYYVGQVASDASNAALTRFKGHKSASQATAGSKTAADRIYADSKLAEYGADNFEVAVLEDNVASSDLDAKEHELIAAHNTFTDPNGWNVKP